jgi:hypothetical protein
MPRSRAVEQILVSYRQAKGVNVVAKHRRGSVSDSIAGSAPTVNDAEVPVTRSGWIAIRAAGPSHPESPTGNVFGHTSAVYSKVDGRPIDARTDAAFFVEWIDRLHADIRKRGRIPDRHLDHVESQIREGRAVFSRLSGKAD